VYTVCIFSVRQKIKPFWFLIGDQAALHNVIKRGEIEMAKIQEYTAGQLKEFCKFCKIPYSGKSQVN